MTLHGPKQFLVYLNRQRIIDQDVRTEAQVRRTNISSQENIPIVLALKVLSLRLLQLIHLSRLDIFRNTLVQRFRDHCDLVLLVRCLGVAFQRRRHRNCFSKTTTDETLISISEYIRLRSCITQSMYISPVPKITCSPLSSTLVRRRG